MFLVDLETHLITFWYEKYHLWETSIVGLLIGESEFATLSSEGFHVVGLGKKVRLIKNKNIDDTMLYPLKYCTDLGMEVSNLILYQQ